VSIKTPTLAAEAYGVNRQAINYHIYKFKQAGSLDAVMEAIRRDADASQKSDPSTMDVDEDSPTGSSPTGSAPTGSAPTGSAPTGSGRAHSNR
jgi:hypothetical protein